TALTGCSITVPGGAKFSCATDADCGGDGYTCVNGACCDPSQGDCAGTGGGQGGGSGGNCGAGLAFCKGACVDVASSNDHCGFCDNVCPASCGCSAGVC